jgi:hypothetical protein
MSNTAPGASNTAVGYKAMMCPIGLGTSNNNPIQSVAIGYEALTAVSTGDNNVAVGFQAMSGSALAGNNNVAVGMQAGKVLQGAAHSNTFIGAQSGLVATTAVENTVIGFNCELYDATATNQIIIGNNLTGTDLDNSVYIGNDSSHIQNDFNADATWTHSSDVRQKKEIKNEILGLDFINTIRPVTYKHKSPSEFPKEWAAYNSDDKEPMGGDKVIHGLIAQEVKESLDEQGIDTFGGWSEDHEGRQRVSFDAFVTPLIKSVQELTEMVKAQQKEIEELKKK